MYRSIHLFFNFTFLFIIVHSYDLETYNMRITLTFFSIPLIIIHLVILYLWIINWQHLYTYVGLVSWTSSILGGLLLSLAFRKWIKDRKRFIVQNILLVTTLMMIGLVVLSLIIESIVSSMP